MLGHSHHKNAQCVQNYHSRYQSLQNCCKIFNVFDCFANTRRYRVKKIHSAKCFSTLPQNTTTFETEVNWFTICAMPLFVKIYLACISPYSISAACSIRSLWWLSSNSSSNENKKKWSLNQGKVKPFKQNGNAETHFMYFIVWNGNKPGNQF